MAEKTKKKAGKKQIVLDTRFRVMMENGQLVRDKNGDVIIKGKGYGDRF